MSSLAAPASAQEEEILIAIYGIASTVGSTINVLTTMGIVMTVQGSGGDGSAAATEQHLRQNAVQLARDLAVGDGPALAELASALGLKGEEARILAGLMREDRARLLDLADVDRLDRARAVAFAHRIRLLMGGHPRLRPELDRLQAASGFSVPTALKN